MTALPFATHYLAETLLLDLDGIQQQLSVSEFVSAGQLLASLKEDGSESPINLIAGKNCLSHDNGKTIVTEVAGYPSLNSKVTDGDISDATIDVTPLIEVAEGNMLVTLSIYPELKRGKFPTVEDIILCCKDKGVTHGIDEAIIRETIIEVQESGHPSLNVPIAHGTLPVDGQNAFLHFNIDIGPLPGKILEDGSIDWRERKIFIGVEEGELIATKIHPTEGEPGANVFGDPIYQVPGKDLKVRVTGDVEYVGEKSQVLATKPGVLSVVNEQDIKVNAKQTINGDIDFLVGNIESKNCLEIKGDVKPGFTVSCTGDLSIEGNITNGIILAKSNCKIAGGLIGEKSICTVGGDLEVNFIEKGCVKSDGTVAISKAAYYSTTYSTEKIICHPGSNIVGGVFAAGLDFIGDTVGSVHAAPTEITVGVDLLRLKMWTNLKQKIKQDELDIENLLQRYGPDYVNTLEFNRVNSALQKQLKDLKRINLIPRTPLYSRKDSKYRYSPASITIYGKVAEETKIRIGNIRTTVTEAASAIRFHIDISSGHIIASPSKISSK